MELMSGSRLSPLPPLSPSSIGQKPLSSHILHPVYTLVCGVWCSEPQTLLFICKGELLLELGNLFSLLPKLGFQDHCLHVDQESLKFNSKVSNDFLILDGTHCLLLKQWAPLIQWGRDNHRGHDLRSTKRIHWFNVWKTLSLSHTFQSSCFFLFKQHLTPPSFFEILSPSPFSWISISGCSSWVFFVGFSSAPTSPQHPLFMLYPLPGWPHPCICLMTIFPTLPSWAPELQSTSPWYIYLDVSQEP